MIKKLMRVAMWLLAGGLGLLLLAVGWVLYVTYSFDTEKLPERHGQFDLVLHPRPEPGAPLIVTLGGAEGGNSWNRKRWQPQIEKFRELGFSVLTVGYFGTPTTPESLDRIDLSALHRLVREQMARPELQSSCLIVMGGSKGAELSLALASHFNDIDAVVAMSPADTVFPAHNEAMTTSSWMLDGKALPFAPLPWSTLPDLISGNIGAVMARTLAQPEAAAGRIPTERITAPILLIASDKDEMWPALDMARRIEAKGQGNVRLLAVPGDHAAVIDHMGAIEEFLTGTVARLPKCAMPKD